MKIAITYGFVIALVITLVNSFFVDGFGIEHDFVRKYSGFSPFIIVGIGLFLAMKKAKGETYHNDLNFGQAIYTGIVVCAFIALFSAIFNFLYFQFINVNYADEVIRIATPLMQADKMSEKEIAEQIVQIKETYKPVNQLTGTFVIMLVIGIFFSAIYGAILRTKDTFSLQSKEKE